MYPKVDARNGVPYAELQGRCAAADEELRLARDEMRRMTRENAELQDELKRRGRKRLRGLLKRQRTNSEEARSSAERGKIKGRYGLVLPARLAAGAEVKAGDVLGEIGRMGNDGMLHFEIYPKGAEGTSRWLKDELSSNDQAKRLRRGKSVRAKPTSTRRRFLDPTLYLRFLALHGL